MKTISISALLLVVTISLSSFVLSSKDSNATTIATVKGPGMLRVHRQGSAISLTWSNQPNAVAFRVERGDGEFFEAITIVENTGARTHSYKDTGFFPGVIYYRVVCIDADGNEECSNTEVIKITQRR